ncbi:MAG: hypothetical protein IJ571_02430 [Ruminococcus sp.]|nr:hypothetical protein [Ruminococcus sp.]
MDKELYDLLENVTAEELMPAAELLEEIAEKSKSALPNDMGSRIHSCVIRKAGIEMKGTNEKKIGRHSKRFVGAMVAAAVLVTGAIGAGAYAAYNNGFFNGAKALYPDTELSDKDIDNIASITGEWNGEVFENTFDGLEFTIDGTVNDGQTSCVMLTVSKTNGEPFTLEEGEHYYFKYGGGSVPFDDYHNEPDPAYREYKTQLNEDGTLSVIMYNTWPPVENAPEKESKFQARFVELYKSDMSKEYFDNELADAALPCLLDRNETADGKPTDEHDSAYQAIIDKIATEKYDGSFTFSFELTDAVQPITILPEDNEYGYEITIGCICIQGSTENDDFAKSKVIDAFDNEVTIYFSDETSIIMNTTGGWSEDTKTGECIGSVFTEEYPKPININDVTAVEINGNRIEIDR